MLQRVDDELKRRGDLFRKLGVQDIAGYKRAGGKEPIPRTLLLIDEFQEFFVEDDKIAQSASLLLDRIVRQGRAFGIHVLLGSQTLGGAYTLARTTLGQMVIRIALQCNEADAYLIMDDNNPAPRLLSRPGEGIYNDDAGALEGNSPFQVVWLPTRSATATSTKVRASGRPQTRPPIPARSSSKATPPPTSAKTLSCSNCSQAPAIKPAPVPAHLARRAQLDQRPHRSRVPPPERQQPAHRRPARRSHPGHVLGRADLARRPVSARAPSRFIVLDGTPARHAAAASIWSRSSRPSRTRSTWSSTATSPRS